MSDLATFVAATLYDKAMSDLLEENQKLQDEIARLKESRKAQITGRGGSPVYAEGSLDDAVLTSPYEETVNLKNCTGENADSTLAMCNIQDVWSAEIRVGGKRMYVVDRNTLCATIGHLGDIYNTYRYWYNSEGDDREGDDREDVTDACVVMDIECGPLPERFQNADSPQGPDLHWNNEIDEVRFLSIHFRQPENVED